MTTARVHTGRRKGGEDTRAMIEAAARRQFSDLGYDRASLRRIAQEAGVDPTLVSHFYGSKLRLFLAVVSLPFSPADIVAAIAAGEQDQIGARLAGAVLDLLEAEPTRRRLVSLVRAGLAEPEVAARMREVLSRDLLLPIARRLAAGNAEYRASLAMSQIVGLIVARYIVGIEPLATRAPDEILAALAPTLQRYLAGELSP